MKTFQFIALIAGALTLSFVAFADGPNGGKPKMSPEMRQKMADVHQKMAECLRSDRPLNDCHQEMIKTCQEKLGKDGCPMGGMHGHMGMQGPGGMNGMGRGAQGSAQSGESGGE